MKEKQLPAGVTIGIAAGLVLAVGLLFYFTLFREPPALDPRTIPKEQIIDPDPPRTRDQQPGRGPN